MVLLNLPLQGAVIQFCRAFISREETGSIILSSVRLRRVTISIRKFKTEPKKNYSGGLRIPGTFAPILSFNMCTVGHFSSQN